MSVFAQSGSGRAATRPPVLLSAALVLLFFLPWVHWTIDGEPRSLAGYDVLVEGFRAPTLSRQAAEAAIAEQDAALNQAIERARERAAEARADADEAEAEAAAAPGDERLSSRAERRVGSAERAEERIGEAERQLEAYRQTDHELWTHSLFYLYPLLLLLLPLGTLGALARGISGRSAAPFALAAAAGGIWALMAPHLWFGMSVVFGLTPVGVLVFLLSLALIPAALGLERTADAIDQVNRRIGTTVAWLALFMVLVQFALVLMRYVFGIGSIMTQESLIYAHGTLFMVAAGYTLLVGGHVRVDIFYREAEPRKKAWVDLIGVTVLLIPVCLLIWRYSLPYVLSSWAVLEGSRETSGIQGVYLLKSCILVFVVLMSLQGLSLAFRSILVIAGLRKTAGTATAGGH
ncbi:TRAP transporter small permease subunit [Algihabitans sp.]|uniref:TRAP transporter small permease subunit n=1 Tax=Algihabitans sp. TaxID=2821514 RepID=UPI003BAB1D57